MLLANARRDDREQLPLEPPALGARRLPGPRLRDHHRAACELVGAVSELKQRVGPRTLLAAAALADSVILVVNEVVGHDLARHRERFSEAAHFGGLLAAAEELEPGGEPGLTAPHAAAVLACVEAQFDETDKLAEQLSRWLLETGYFLVRTGSATGPLVASLRADLVRLLAEVEDAVAPVARLPRPTPAPDNVADTAIAGR